MVSYISFEEDLKKGILYYPISENCCPKCKTNQRGIFLCDKCKRNMYPFKTVFALGYYYPRWARQSSTQISPDYFKNRLGNINPRYLFSELLIHAKGRSKVSTEKKNLIYDYLVKSLANKLITQFPNIIEKIDFLVHVPKKNENKSLYYNNHAIYYSKFLSQELNIPFERYMLVSKGDHKPIEIEFNAEKIDGSRIMIVDDIFRKGNQKGPLSKLLIDNKAKEVYIGVIGKTIDLNNYYNIDPIKMKPY